MTKSVLCLPRWMEKDKASQRFMCLRSCRVQHIELGDRTLQSSDRTLQSSDRTLQSWDRTLQVDDNDTPV